MHVHNHYIVTISTNLSEVAMYKQLWLLLLLVLFSAQVSSKSVYLTGSLEAVMPKVKFVQSPPFYKGVKVYEVNVQAAAGSGCDITHDLNEAMAIRSGDKLVCLFEWVEDTDPGIRFDGLRAFGRQLGQVGKHTRTYKLSFFSGAVNEKIEIMTDSVEYEVVEPPAPVITSISTQTNKRTSNITDIISHDVTERLQSLKITVEPRPYDQEVLLEQFGRDCAVPEGETSCELNYGGIKITNDDDILVGQIASDVKLSDPYDYTVANTRLRYRWDFRPPVIEDFIVHAVGQKSLKTGELVVNGQTVIARNNEGLVVISSPHSSNDEDRWWLPEDLDILLVPNTDIQNVRDYVTLFNKPIGHLFKNNLDHMSTDRITSLRNPEQIGDKFVYRFDVGSVPDGNFVVTVDAKDVYSNRVLKTKDDILLDRLAPEIHVFNNEERISSGSAFYFGEHLIFTAQDSVSREVSITDLKLNGVNLETTGEYPLAQAIKSFIKPDANTVQTFEVEAIDGSGNTVKRKFSFNYLPIAFRYEGVDNKKYSIIQEQNIGFVQVEGQKCRIHETEDLAIFTINRRGTLACTVEWEEIPDGLEPDMTNATIIGRFWESGLTNVIGKVFIHDKDRRKSQIAEYKVELKVNDPYLPQVQYSDKGMFKEGVYAVEHGYHKISQYTIYSPNASIRYKIYSGDTLLSDMIARQSSRSNELSVRKTLSDRLGALKFDVWDVQQYRVEVSYVLSPDLTLSAPVEAYIVPSSRIRASHESETKELSNLNRLQITSNVGVYDRKLRQNIYNVQDHGEWEVRVIKTRRDRTSEPMTDWLAMNADGQNQFDLGLTDQEIGSLVYRVEARIKSPVYPEYERELNSRTSRVRILKGEAIDGQIATSRIHGPAPLRTSIKYDFETSSDQKAVGDITWYMSSDGESTWQIVGTGKKYDFRTDRAGLWSIKAVTENRFTGRTSTSQTLELMSYLKPDIDLVDVYNTIVGRSVTVALNDHGQRIDESNAIIEWSTDGGKTYKEGGATYTTSANYPTDVKLAVRASYINYERDPKAWDMDKAIVRVLKAKPVNIRTSTTLDVEVGDTLTIKPEVKPPYTNLKLDIVTNITKQDGTLIEAAEYDFTPTEEDRLVGQVHWFNVESWLEGSKLETYAQKKMAVNVWEYQFPNFRLITEQRIKAAPSVIKAWVHKPAVANLYEDFDIEFNGHGRLEISSETNGKVVFNANTPGLYPISVDITDERGNTAQFTDLIEVFEPQEISINNNMSQSNKFAREPLDVRFRPVIKLGHPKDRIKEYKWYINDEFSDKHVKSYARVEGLSAGTHSIKLEIETMFGQKAEYTEIIDVVENKLPTCRLDNVNYSKYIRLRANCTDEDGKMKRYTWYVNDIKRAISSNSLTLHKSMGDSISVRVIAYDDSGDSVEMTDTYSTM